MPDTTPLYDLHEIVYLRESAAIGHLEAVRISGIQLGKDGWMYAIAAGLSSPTTPAIHGDRISFVSTAQLWFSEDELVVACDALVLAEANAQRALSRLQLQRASLCPDTG